MLLKYHITNSKLLFKHDKHDYKLISLPEYTQLENIYYIFKSYTYYRFYH